MVLLKISSGHYVRASGNITVAGSGTSWTISDGGLVLKTKTSESEAKAWADTLATAITDGPVIIVIIDDL